VTLTSPDSWRLLPKKLRLLVILYAFWGLAMLAGGLLVGDAVLSTAISLGWFGAGLFLLDKGRRRKASAHPLDQQRVNALDSTALRLGELLIAHGGPIHKLILGYIFIRDSERTTSDPIVPAELEPHFDMLYYAGLFERLEQPVRQKPCLYRAIPEAGQILVEERARRRELSAQLEERRFQIKRPGTRSRSSELAERIA
jgi:hypothetical protein